MTSWVREIVITLPTFPAPSAIANSTLVVDRDGNLLRPFTIGDGLWRLPVAKADVDPKFFDMLLGYEDRHFEDHHGVDWDALLRAAGQFAVSGHIVSGGSTLTMQVARLLDGGDTRTLGGKIKQIAEAVSLEHRFTKDEIMDLYLDARRPMAAISRASALQASPISARSRRG